MSEKARENYKIGLCMKFDCINRDKKCDVCINFSEYLKKCICKNPKLTKIHHEKYWTLSELPRTCKS